MEATKTVHMYLSNSTDRQVFDRLKKQYPNMLIAPSSLRSEQILEKGKQSYNFPIEESAGNISKTEKRLARNDRFVITSIGMFLLQRDPLIIGHEVLQTYPNATAFTPIVDLLNPLHLETIYNGKWFFTVDQLQIITGRDLLEFRYVGDTQQTAADNKSSMDKDSGFVGMEPQITLDGDKKTSFDIYVPFDSSHLIVGDATHKTHIAFIFRGFLISNSPIKK
ncbi:MAG: hypothetical protein HOO91_17805 [Bacteroidales bacterium]|nr:hypothetical protein [Bacteroidales bacterium]